jgi:hypothetical protein
MLHYADIVLGNITLFYKQFFSLPQSCANKEENTKYLMKLMDTANETFHM